MAEINPEIIITAKDEASSVLKGLANNAEKTGESLSTKLKNSAADLGVAFAGVTGIMYTSIKAFDESQRATKQLDAVLKSTKGVAGVTKDEVIKLASALQQQTTFSDEAVVGAENLLLTFTNIGKNVFPQATQTVLDMSIALGQDTKSSAIQLGKALQDPILGVTALRRVGVNFSEDQKNVIENLVKTGHSLEAQKLILKELSTEFGGSAKNAAQTFSGQMTILANNVNDVQETIGQGLIETLTKLTGGFDNANKMLINLNQFLGQHKDIVFSVSIALIALAVAFGGLFIVATAALAGISAGMVALGAVIIAGTAFIAGMIISHWNTIKTTVMQIVDSIKAFIAANWETIKLIMLSALNAMTGGWLGFAAGLLNSAKDTSSKVASAFSNMGNSVKSTMESLGSKSAEIFNNIKNAVNGLISWVANTVNNFRPSFTIGINLPNIEAMWNDLKKKARNLGIPGFATGGIVPGAIGTPQLILAHGGEEVVPHGSRANQGGGGGGGGGATFNVYVGMYAGSEIEKRNIAAELYNQLMILAGSQNKSVSEYFGA